MSALDRYVVGQLAGRGGMGEVWRASCGGREVAIKRLHAGARGAALIDEIHAIAALEHPNVVPILDADPDGGWFVMPWADRTWAGRTLDWGGLRAVLEAVLMGLAHAHARGRLHLDLKPSNLLVFGEIPDRLTALADFGVSRARGQLGGRGWGSAGFASPEQLEGRWRDVGPGSDLFGAGQTGLALWTGAPPDDAALDALLAGCPAEIAAFWEGMVNPDPDGRFEGAPQALAALRALPDWTPIPGDARTSAPTGTSWDAGAVRRPRGSAPARVVLPPGDLPPARNPRPDGLGSGLALLEARQIGLIGRDAERQALWDALIGVVTRSEPTVIRVDGAAGAGASHLARWLAHAAAEVGCAEATVVAGRTERIADGLARALGVAGLEWADAVQRLSRRTSEPELLAAAALPERQAPPALLAGALTALGARAPQVLVVDDADALPDLDGLTRELLGRRPCRVLLVAVRGSPAMDAAGAQVLPIGPLPDAEIEATLIERLALDPQLADRLVARAGGNPSLALGWLAEAAARGALVEGPRGLVLAEHAPPLPNRLTDRFDDVLATWLTDPALEDAAERLAAMDEPLDEAVWAEVVREPSVRERVLVGLAARRLVERASRWVFREPLAREALRSRAASAGRAAGQRADIAAALRRLGAPPGRIGAHLLAAGHLHEAADACIAGAFEALAGQDLRQVSARLTEAEAALDGLEEQGARRARVGVLAAQLDSLRGRLEDAEARARAALTSEASADTRGYAERVLASVALLRGDRPAAAEGFARARALYVEAGARDRVGLCDLDRGGVVMWLGQLDEAERDLSAAREALASSPDRGLRASVWIALGRLALFRADPVGARQATARAISELDGRPSPQLAIALNDLGLHALHAGDLPSAADAFDRSEKLMAQLGFYAIGHPRLNRARVDAALHRFDDAQARLDAVPDGPALAAPQMRALRLALQVRVAAGRSDAVRLEAALSALEAGPAPAPSPAGDPLALLREAAVDAPALAGRIGALWGS